MWMLHCEIDSRRLSISERFGDGADQLGDQPGPLFLISGLLLMDMKSGQGDYPSEK